MNIKYVVFRFNLWFLCVSFLLLLSIFSLTSCNKNTGKEEDILKICNEINGNISKYKLISIDGYPEPEKRKINAYYNDEQIKLIIEEYYTDSGRFFTHYFINAEELIFVYRESFIYNMPVYYTEDSAKIKNDTNWYDDKKTILKTSSYYFAKNNLKKWINNSKEMPLTGKEYTNQQEELVGNCLFMLKMLKSKDEYK